MIYTYTQLLVDPLFLLQKSVLPYPINQPLSCSNKAIWCQQLPAHATHLLTVLQPSTTTTDRSTLYKIPLPLPTVSKMCYQMYKQAAILGVGIDCCRCFSPAILRALSLLTDHTSDHVSCVLHGGNLLSTCKVSRWIRASLRTMQVAAPCQRYMKDSTATSFYPFAA
jgi:hypothetical protein